MNKFMQYLLIRGLPAIAMIAALSAPAYATCERNNYRDYPMSPLQDNGSAQFWFGQIDLGSAALQPVGTLLATATATAGQATARVADKVQ